MTSGAKASWIAADWGTTNLRVWMLDEVGGIVHHASSEKGMGKLERREFEPVLLDLIDPFLTHGQKTPVVICGMAGSRQGWAEAPYRSAPCGPPSIEDATAVITKDARIDVRILPGIKQLDPADVMRGEETQIAGFLADHPDFTGTLCLPGTHTKWCEISFGIVKRFRTFMTGEIFSLLSEQSVLRHSLSKNAPDTEAFTNAVKHCVREPESLAAELFGIRAGSLVADLLPETARSRLSGLLIGSELASITKNFSVRRAVILGSDHIAQAYATALSGLGHSPQVMDASAITLRGLTLAHNAYRRLPQ
ncbi:2-dehydro-3-deoxygalactonokinase [Roseibium denhamense]|uniref:2-dehydro-3-deoxygalactonokinase n=1 Tax=Roseibium denhamense TaxID=76305 RepID=A0ABY1NHW4_9HYPH|nr:2-dehydro-3-deoxygalactonokinase [Roseibium denhamense]MTI05063.1 2-dehydro-3-deoxygalactonokinase [Roseibium denhamense]SMP10172.1 2-dehydro-3-deoxygalactonokinase [Roseibium denhamense]